MQPLLTPLLFASIVSYRKDAQHNFHEVVAAPGIPNHTEFFFCFCISIPLYSCKSPLTLTSVSDSADILVVYCIKCQHVTTQALLVVLCTFTVLNVNQSLIP